jgi:predicted chitinase
MFSAGKSNPNRVSLYAKLANRFVKNTNYTVLRNHDAITDFVLKYGVKYVYERQMNNYAIYVIAKKDIVDPEKNVEDQVDEGWKETLATAGLAGAIGLGSTGVMNLKQKMSAPSTTTTSQQVVANPEPKPVQKLVTPSTPQQVKQQQASVSKKQPVEVKYITDSPLEKLLMDTAKKAGIVGEELAQFMAQCAHESWDFKFMVEKGKNYKRYEPVYKRNPSTKKVVNVNTKAAILGNTKLGDGFKYRGRGFIQLTGKYNYKKAGEALNLPLVENPKLLEDPKIAAIVSVWFWNHRVKPNISDFSNTKEVTKKINPALRGLEDRHDNFEDYLVSMN